MFKYWCATLATDDTPFTAN